MASQSSEVQPPVLAALAVVAPEEHLAASQLQEELQQAWVVQPWEELQLVPWPAVLEELSEAASWAAP